jgi:four helix bundle protein
MSDEYVFSFEKLRVWQQAREWIGQVYSITDQFPKSEAYNMTSQMNREAVSVATNLAEGSARNTGKDQAHFSGLSYSSLMETAYLSILAADRGYLDQEQLGLQGAEISAIANQIHALRQSQLRQ